MTFSCQEHGKIHRVGVTKVDYCPICGKKVIPIFLIPKIYIDKSVTGTALGLVILYVVLAFGLGSLIKGCEAESAAKAAKMASMDPAWHSLYLQLKKCNDFQEIDVTKAFVAANGPYLKTHPVTPDELELILDAASEDGEVSKLLTPYEAVPK